MFDRRVVVTGYGAVSCVGNTADATWESLLKGRCGIGAVTSLDVTDFKVKIAGEVKNFDALTFLGFKDAKRLDLFSQYACSATFEALERAGLPRNFQGGVIDANRVGITISSGIGGINSLTQQHRVLIDKGPNRVSPLMIPLLIANMGAGNVAMQIGARGPNMGYVTACASGCHSIGEAAWMIARDDADVMICGGAEAAVNEMALSGFAAMKALSTNNDDPQHSSRPFDLNRDGFVIGEGAGVLVLEELGHAMRRGARIIAEIIGYGATCDAYHITSPSPDGEGAAEAIRIALRHAKITPDEVDYINAHGTGTTLNDKFETAAIKSALGAHAREVAISSTKGSTGHMLGAAGGLESMVCVKAIETGVVPPTINYETPDPECDLDYTPNTPKSRDIRVAMNNNLGFGGHNATLIFRKFDK